LAFGGLARIARVTAPLEIPLMQQNITHCKGYSYMLVNIDCLRDSTHFNVIMDLERSIDDLLPYLAARLPGCTYTHGTGVINLMDTGHIVGIHPRQITITDVAGSEEARTLCAKYFSSIQEVEANRSSITPVLKKRSTITVMAILRALPGTNCGVCESATCMAFAARVFRREVSIGMCEPVGASPESYESLLEQLNENGYPVP
jgi:ArsR family metal-binding transcriptional regulator